MHAYPNYYKKFHNYIKKIFSSHKYKKKLFAKYKDDKFIIWQIRNISDYENKSKEDLIKTFSEPETKPETSKPKPEAKPKP